jgi:alpha-mannosidase
VGWEPDTFGHCWTLPQILRKSGIDSYYFCRAGKGVPLFWWEGPDGSRVLAFEEPATGGWYNDVVNDEKVRELARFILGTGSFDHLMVYGVGNHGGGPTREYIEAALAMRDRSPWPNVRFSTASELFRRLQAQADQLEIPTLRTELNPVFEGCYTTHARIKRLNRQSESLLESAEVFAALATLRGDAYPRAAFEDMWRDVLWNHHHDTLPGSFIHASYRFSAQMYEDLLERGRAILERAQRRLIRHGSHAGDESCVVVFNPLAWPRSEVVEARLEAPASAGHVTLHDAQGRVPTQILRRQVNGDLARIDVCFVARDVPGCGYKAFRLETPTTTNKRDPARPSPSAPAIQPVLQVLNEKPHGMSAWRVGEYGKVADLGEPASVEQIEAGPVRWRSRETHHYDKSTIIQDTVTYAHCDRVDFEAAVEWLQLGNGTDGGPMLKAAFATGVSADHATYEIPFGDIDRPTDGHENVALKWCAVADDTQTVAVLNDCKHAYDVKDGVVRLTLLRTSYEPDPTPDVGQHRMRYGVLHTNRPLDKAAVTRAAWAFNKPLRARVLHQACPATFKGCTVGPDNVVLTGFKCGEDDDRIILRAYECAGRSITATFELGFDVAGVVEVDLLERDVSSGGRVGSTARSITAEFRPYEIRTFRVTIARESASAGTVPQPLGERAEPTWIRPHPVADRRAEPCVVITFGSPTG